MNERIFEARALANNLRNEADRLLEKTRIFEILQKQGEVNLGGSYEYDLMVDKDLDFGVIIPEFSTRIRSEIITSIAENDWVYGMNISDRIQFKPLSNLQAPLGLFVGLTVPFPVDRWNIDIWFMLSDQVPEDNVGKRVKEATESQKNEMLLKKYEALMSGKKEKGKTSYEIYKEVFGL